MPVKGGGRPLSAQAWAEGALNRHAACGCAPCALEAETLAERLRWWR